MARARHGLEVAILVALPLMSVHGGAAYAVPLDESRAGSVVVRAFTGVGGPTGELGISVAAGVTDWLFVDASLGIGVANYLLAGTVRAPVLRVPNWQLTLGAGIQRGFRHDGGLCSLSDSPPPASTARTTWLHAEVAWERIVRRGFSLFVGLGVEELVSGGYHFDLSDVNLINSRPGSVFPYARVGLGYSF